MENIPHYSDGPINIVSHKTGSLQGDKGGVKMGSDPQDAPTVDNTIGAKCTLNFRPNRQYDGEFGFDWVRTGDTNFGEIEIPELKNMLYGENQLGPFDPFLDYAFQDVVGFANVGYDAPEYAQRTRITHKGTELMYDVFKAVPQQDKLYKELLNQYTCILIDGQRYYIPVLSLLPGKKASLDIYVTCQEVIDKIELRIAGDTTNALTISTNSLTSVQQSKELYKVDITCNAEFDNVCALEAYKFPKGDLVGVLCGKVWIIPNSTKYHKEVKVLLINVSTNLNEDNTAVSPDDIDLIKNKMNRYFAQGLLFPTVDVTDLSFQDSEAKTVMENNSLPLSEYDCEELDLELGTKAVASDKRQTVNEHIRKMLMARMRKEVLEKYKDYRKVFLFPEILCGTNGNQASLGSEMGGVNFPLNRDQIICYKAGINGETVSHEIFHSLGLKHPFSGPNCEKYLFKKAYTSNIMDYSRLTNVTYFWQWRQMNNKIKKLP